MMRAIQNLESEKISGGTDDWKVYSRRSHFRQPDRIDQGFIAINYPYWKDFKFEF